MTSKPSHALLILAAALTASLMAAPHSAAQPTEAETGAPAAGRLTYIDIVRRLYDVRLLAEPPLPGERSGSMTSGDRASRFDGATRKYVDWRANADGKGFIRKEGDGGDIVAFEQEGPGVIWRIWSAKPENGAVRIFIDGADKPVLDLPFRQLFDNTKGPFPFPELVRNMAGGWNCFVPIPYQKSCRIVLAKGWGEYFQFHYSRFADGTVIPSFTGSLDPRELRTLAKADSIWKERTVPASSSSLAAHSTVTKVREASLTIAPGGSTELPALTGAGAISGLEFTLPEFSAASEKSPPPAATEEEKEKAKPKSKTDTEARLAATLREVTLSIFWDGDAQPAVWAPLGDFFGSAPGLNPYRSLLAGMTPDSMRSSWYMPFGKGAVIRLTNDGKTPVRLNFKITTESLVKPADQLLRFHAKWHRDHYGSQGIAPFAADRYPDWPVLLARGGPGRFCGMHLHVWNPLHIWDQARAMHYQKTVSELCGDTDWFRREVIGQNYWYGEGDEKFFVDGEKYPSTYGTGTEDYFGFAWGTPQVFDSATQCQTVNTNNTGHISLLRWQVMDNVPFHQQFEGVIEKYHGNNWPLHYAATAFWYQAPGIADEYPAVPVEQRLNYYTMPEKRPLPVPTDGIYDGETHFDFSPEAGAKTQDMRPFGPDWHGGAHLLWGGVGGDALDLTFEIPEARTAKLELHFTRAADYGAFDVLLDGRVVASDVDGYADRVLAAPPLDLGEARLEAGKHTLTLRMTGANPAAKKFQDRQYLLGLDYLRIIHP